MKNLQSILIYNTLRIISNPGRLFSTNNPNFICYSTKIRRIVDLYIESYISILGVIKFRKIWIKCNLKLIILPNQ